MIVCCGEALIDFLPRETRDGALAFQPFSGGSIYNTAVALGRQGVPVAFFGGMSSDFFGDQLRGGLAQAHVDVSLSPVTDRHTICAFVTLENGHARYSFIDEGSASRMLGLADLPVLQHQVAALHFGSISLVPEPCGGAYEALAARESATRVISYDPNVRPGVIKDRAAFLARADRMAALADIVKLSDEDLNWFAPGVAEEDFARRWLEAGARLVTITRGGNGATGFTAAGRTDIAGIAVQVADTVGAGDTFTAGTLAALRQRGLLGKAAIAALGADALRDVLSFAARAAAITVSRAGADPPWAREMT